MVTENEKRRWGIDLNLVKMKEDEEVEARRVREEEDASLMGTAIFKCRRSFIYERRKEVDDYESM